jgi:hypothetical protein
MKVIKSMEMRRFKLYNRGEGALKKILRLCNLVC